MSKAAELAALIGSQTALSNRNLVINGAMQCWQRATSATAAANTYNTVDRYIPYEVTDGAYTTERSTDTPTGTGYSLKCQVTTADTSLAAGQYSFIQQRIEAQNLQHLEYGTSSAKAVTLSFWVKSNKTGTYTISLYKHDSTAYNYTREYTIDSADTWEKKELTISPTAGSTTFITSSGGSIANDNGEGLHVNINLAWGSTYTGGTSDSWSSDANDYATTNQVNWMDSTSNNFYLAQVQLEVGEQATPFEHRSYGDELLRCRRYFQPFRSYSEYSIGTTGSVGNTPTAFVPAMRATPTFTVTSTAGSNSSLNSVSSYTGGLDSVYQYALNFAITSSGYMYILRAGTADAEL